MKDYACCHEKCNSNILITRKDFFYIFFLTFDILKGKTNSRSCKAKLKQYKKNHNQHQNLM